MSRKPVPAQSGDRARVELLFDKPQLLVRLFGQYDQNLVALENRLGVYITARGNKIGLEGTAEQVAKARRITADAEAYDLDGRRVHDGTTDDSIALIARKPTLRPG